MIQGVPSFKGFYMTDKGKEKIQNEESISFIERELIPTAKMAKENPKNTLSIEDDGHIYITTPNDGKFTVNNPANAKIYGRHLNCTVRTPEGEVKKISVLFENQSKAEKFKDKSFSPGSYIPSMNLDLYRAILAADNYKQNVMDELSALMDN